jgi:hypothetical protein
MVAREGIDPRHADFQAQPSGSLIAIFPARPTLTAKLSQELIQLAAEDH